jgi:hypothetical protein
MRFPFQSVAAAKHIGDGRIYWAKIDPCLIFINAAQPFWLFSDQNLLDRHLPHREGSVKRFHTQLKRNQVTHHDAI